MRIYQKKKFPSGRRDIFIFGIKIFSYHNKKRVANFDPNITLEKKVEIICKDFAKHTGYTLDLKEPKTFNEKMQWLKLFYKNPLVPICGDKYQVRAHVAKEIGEEYLVPLLGAWDTPDEIPFSTLPNEFVLKVNWGSGQNIIVRDKTKLNIEQAKDQLAEWLKPESCHYYMSFEPSYFGFPPKIICEKYIGELADNLTCYKIFNFSGKPYLIQAVFDDKTKQETINYYDLEWNKLDLRQNFPNNPNPKPAPKNLEKMLLLAEKLATPFPYFVRTDFYEIGDVILFSEFTFFSDNGMATFMPKQWDYTLGDFIHISPSDIKQVNENLLSRVKIPQELISPPLTTLYRKELIPFEGLVYIGNGETGVFDANERYAQKEFEFKDMLAINKAIGTAFLDTASSVVNIGSGVGTFEKQNAQLFPNTTFIASEFDAASLEWAKTHRPFSNVTYCSDTMDTLLHKYGKFDLAVSIDVIEHVAAYKEFLDMYSQLSDKAVISTPNRDRYADKESLVKPPYDRHAFEWNAGELYFILKMYYNKVTLYAQKSPLDIELIEVGIYTSYPKLIAYCEK